jgi:hypothetical protein
VKQTANITIENLGKGYLPQFTMNTGDLSIRCNRVQRFFGGINIQAPDKDQYKVLADLNQLIYDGGVIRQQSSGTIEWRAATAGRSRIIPVKNRINQVTLVFISYEEIKQGISQNKTF